MKLLQKKDGLKQSHANVVAPVFPLSCPCLTDNQKENLIE